MSNNTILTPQEIAMESLARLNNNLVFAGLVHRDFENEFATKGDKIQVRKPATFVAKDFNGTTETQNITEGNVDVMLDKIADITIEVTSKQLTLDIKDFGNQVIQGAMEAIAQKVDADVASLYKDVPFTFGTEGQTPDALSDIAGVGKVLNTNKAPLMNRNLVMDPEAQASLIILDAIANAEKSGTTDGLREANMGRVLGFNTYMSQNIFAHTAGAYANLVDVTAAGTAGESQFVLTSGAGTSTAKLNKGDVFTVDNVKYTVAEDTSAAVAGVVTAKVYPTVKTTIADAEVAFTASHVANLGFHKNAFALVNRPMALPLGGASGYIANYNGLSIRVTMGYNMSSKVNTISFDILYGVKTLTPELATRLLG